MTIDADYLKAKLGGKNAFYHEEGSNLAEQLAYESAKGMRNFNFVGNIKNTPKYSKLFDFLKEKGYTIKADVVSTDLNTAIDRATSRSLRGHQVPISAVTDSWNKFQDGVSLIKNYTKDIKNYDGTKDFKTQYK